MGQDSDPLFNPNITHGEPALKSVAAFFYPYLFVPNSCLSKTLRESWKVLRREKIISVCLDEPGSHPETRLQSMQVIRYWSRCDISENYIIVFGLFIFKMAQIYKIICDPLPPNEA